MRRRSISPGPPSTAARSSASRAAREMGTRVEFRSPDPSCNPYLAFAAIITAGLDGIKTKITPPASVHENIYHMDDASAPRPVSKVYPAA